MTVQRESPYLRALPAYPGGKRRLLPAIFALIAEAVPTSTWPLVTFCDPFLGGGAVALHAKALGFGRVVAGDLAERSAIVGRALIANSQTRIAPELALRLFERVPEVEFPQPALLERVRPPLRDVLAAAWAHLHGVTYAGVERDLMAVVVMKALLRAFPLGQSLASDAPRVQAGEFDRVTGVRLQHYLRVQRLAQPQSLLGLVRDVNGGVMPGVASAVRADAFELVAQTAADVVYLDPPYPRTQRYERAFELVDEFLGAAPLGANPFSSASPPLAELLDACRHIPLLVLSLNNGLLGEGALRALVARHRRVLRVVSLPYRHLAAVESVEHGARNREVLVLADRLGGSPR